MTFLWRHVVWIQRQSFTSIVTQSTAWLKTFHFNFSEWLLQLCECARCSEEYVWDGGNQGSVFWADCHAAPRRSFLRHLRHVLQPGQESAASRWESRWVSRSKWRLRKMWRVMFCTPAGCVVVSWRPARVKIDPVKICGDAHCDGPLWIRELLFNYKQKSWTWRIPIFTIPFHFTHFFVLKALDVKHMKQHVVENPHCEHWCLGSAS